MCDYLQFTPMKRYEFFVALYFTIYHITTYKIAKRNV
ncbi:Hypothetical protein LSL_1396 [Ligilactobacillus salivarius UCC118]|uniref:Uncharacterized protein n=1 Tax=Ligilactobacillus salivarius (strain UCC118) TaxID=362948 RepID=Q1WSC9_LIGS1|nr:Hypothetical protein LSL_1396 [Ligilactobacillus salivarius UCC118]